MHRIMFNLFLLLLMWGCSPGRSGSDLEALKESLDSLYRSGAGDFALAFKNLESAGEGKRINAQVSRLIYDFVNEKRNNL